MMSLSGKSLPKELCHTAELKYVQPLCQEWLTKNVVNLYRSSF